MKRNFPEPRMETQLSQQTQETLLPKNCRLSVCRVEKTMKYFTSALKISHQFCLIGAQNVKLI